MVGRSEFGMRRAPRDRASGSSAAERNDASAKAPNTSEVGVTDAEKPSAFGEPSGARMRAQQKYLGERYCSECASIISEKAELCPACGVRQNPTFQQNGSNPNGGKSKIAASLFAFLLGGIGVHKFYLGRLTAGVLYVAFFWTFIPALLGLIDGVILIAMDDAEFDRMYNARST